MAEKKKSRKPGDIVKIGSGKNVRFAKVMPNGMFRFLSKEKAEKMMKGKK